jgi:hypothetical protein
MHKADKPISITLEAKDWFFLWTVLYDASNDDRVPGQYVDIERIQEAIRQATKWDLTRENVDKALGYTKEK